MTIPPLLLTDTTVPGLGPTDDAYAVGVRTVIVRTERKPAQPGFTSFLLSAWEVDPVTGVRLTIEGAEIEDMVHAVVVNNAATADDPALLDRSLTAGSQVVASLALNHATMQRKLARRGLAVPVVPDVLPPTPTA